MPRPLLPVCLAALTLPWTSGALIVPMPGWTPVGGDANYWTDASGNCLMREERHGQAFPRFGTPEEARAFALKLQGSLGRNVRNVVTQPVDRAGIWSVLAAYDFQEGGVNYRVSQLYLSDSGLLRTVTGSSAAQDAGTCVNEMRDFIRYLAD
ncbi:hypothetical protein GO986_19085 [Deinococcus sp. HMF7620]|uniref:DUF1795 domain-containing protein n=1 Tax=Deinococcus arboris TaxID=2682977 RepID=A0A7C9HTT7_9DEIO|nr:hypothetical protein [Deinococcus arboris]MVN88849.1 hypothetical protein [Deinococcus arboris]